MRNKSAPLVSIIINCHNGEKFLKKAIKSILNQSYKNWEIIFWDNDSKDNSYKIIRDFKDKRIKCFYSNIYNTLYKSRNLAIKKTKGQYICFLDTDDQWLNFKLNKQVKLITSSNYDIIFSNFIIKNEIKKKQHSREVYFNKKKDLTQNFLDDYFLGILTVLMKKKIYKKFEFDSKYQIIGDFDFFLKMSLIYKFYYFKESQAIYRIHNNNLSQKKISLHVKELQTWLKENQKKFKNYNCNSIKLLILKLRLKNFFKFLF